MSNKGVGFNAEIGLDKSKFELGIKQINSSLNSMRREFKSVQDTLKLQWDTDQFNKGQQLVRDRLELVNKKVADLKERISAMNGMQMTEGLQKDLQKYREWLAAAEKEQAQLNQQIAALENIKINADFSALQNGIKTAARESAALKEALRIDYDDKTYIQAQQALQNELKATGDTVAFLEKRLEALNKQPATEGQKQSIKETEGLLNQYRASITALEKEVVTLNNIRTTGLTEDIDAAIEATGDKLKTLKEQLSFKWSNDTFKQSQELAQQQLENTKKKAEILRTELDRLNNLPQNDATRTSAEHLARKLEEVQTEAQQAQVELEKINRLRFDYVTDQLDKFGKKLEGAGRAMLPATAAITAGFVAAGKAGIDFESAMIGVDKTTNLTAEQLKELGEDIRGMSKEIPVAATDLAKLAETAGRLGIAEDNLLGFARVMADMGVASNLAGEQGADMLARFINITGMAQGDVDRLGSSIIALGNNFATSEQEIATMALRLAAMARQAGLSEADTLGLATAMSALGLEAEAGGSAFSKVLVRIKTAVETGNADLKAYAATAGMTAVQFKDAFERDAMGAVLAFVDGLGKAEKQGKSTVVMLEEMGITEIRMRDALLRMAQSSDVVKNAITTSNTAWQENIALQEEADKFYASTASQIEMMKNELVDMGIEMSEALIPILKDMIAGVKDAVQWFGSLNDGQKQNAVVIAGIVAAAGPLLIMIGKLPLMLSNIATAAQFVGDAIAAGGAKAAIATAGLSAAIGLIASGIMALKINAAEATQTTRALDEAVKSSKAAYDAHKKAIDETVTSGREELAQVEKILPRIKELNENKNRTAAEQAELNELVRQANSIIPSLITAVENEAGAWDVNTDAIIRNAQARVDQEELDELLRRQREIQPDKDNQIKIAKELSIELGGLKKQYNDLETAAQSNAYYAMKRLEIALQIAEAEKKLKETVEQSGALSAEAKEIQSRIDELTKSLISYRENAEKPVNSGFADEADNAKAAAVAIDEAAEAYKKATTEIGGLIDLQNRLNKAGEVTPALFGEIVGKYGDMAKAGMDVDKMQAGLNIKIRQQVDAATDAHMAMVMSSKETVKESIANLLNSNQGLVDTLGGLYSTDSANWVNLANDKYTTESTLVNKLSALWSAYYGRTTESLNAEMRYAMDVGDMTRFYAINDFLATQSALKTQFEQLALGVGTSGSGDSKRGGSGGKGKTEEEKAVEAFRAAKADLDYLRDMDAVDAETYYKTLVDLQHKYLKESYDEWRTVNLDLKKYKDDVLKEEQDKLKDHYKQLESDAKDGYKKMVDEAKKAYSERVKASKKANDDELDALKKSQNAAIKEFKSAHETRIKQLQAERDAAVKSIQDQIDHIDKLIEARKRQNEDIDYNKSLAALDAEIRFNRNQENTPELERERARLLKERDEVLWQRNMSDSKDALNKAKDAIKEAYDAQIEAEKEAYDIRLEKLQAQQEIELENMKTKHETMLENMSKAHEQYLADLETQHKENLAALDIEHKKQSENLDNLFSTAQKGAEDTMKVLGQTLSDELVAGVKSVGEEGQRQVAAIRSATADMIAQATASANQQIAQMQAKANAITNSTTTTTNETRYEISAPVRMITNPATTSGQIEAGIRRAFQDMSF